MPAYKSITTDDIKFFVNILGHELVKFNAESLENYSHDETEDYVFVPELVLTPSTAAKLSEIMQYCNTNLIAVTPRGAGTGLSGGALAVHGGIILSMENFNRIIEIDERNLQATVEPGVITEVFQNAVIEKGLFYPPDPASKGSCFIGGNIAESSSGPKAVKYGTTKDYVLDMEVVLPTGEIIYTGAKVLKNATGYNLTQLLVGSEGTLGIVTRITFRLIPLPAFSKLMLVPFYSAEEACEAVSAIFRAGVTPSGLEFMERDALIWGLKYIEDLSMEIPDDIQAHLLIEVDGNHETVLMEECELIYKVLEGFKCDEILLAESSAQKDSIKKLRSNIGEAVKSNSVYKEEDTVVPRAELPKLLSGIKQIGRKYNFQTICYGHAGDGNLHVNIIKGELSDHDWNYTIKEGIREIFKLCVELGGTISGEHGIGYTQKEFLNIALSEKNIELMKGIKKLFDPNGILNPGKIFMENN
jgi:glycolate oxidase